MADYPDWVLEHKKKGTYVNKVGDTYYLYAAHSERIKGTKRVRRVSDGYLGRITEEDGFVPAKRKLATEVTAYEYGLSMTIMRLCARIHSGLRREFKANADFVMAWGVLLFMHGEARTEFYETSWLSVLLPGLDFASEPTEKQRAGIERTARMAADTLKSRFGSDYEEALLLLPLVRVVRMAGDSRVCEAPIDVRAFCVRHGLPFGAEEGKP